MRCPHKNVSDQRCLDCGRSILESDEEYYAYLKRLKFGVKGELNFKIEQLERELGIKHPGNQNDDVCFAP